MISLAYALKKTRRGIYANGNAWRTLVVVQKARQVPVLFDEVLSLMDASSITVETAYRSTNTIKMAGGAFIRCAFIGDLTDAYVNCQGREFTHVIWLYEPEDKIRKFVRMSLRSYNVPEDQLLENT